MERLSDDIGRYIRLTENTAVSEGDADTILERIEVVDLDSSYQLLEDVNDMIFKLRSYSEPDSDLNYARGVEEGLALAANMLERLLERHSGYSSK
jgi:hypothetical protein